ncbi:hypothetical protein T439DRAFT_320792 [Meredithblackwellia eburnea MCA 4105]
MALIKKLVSAVARRVSRRTNLGVPLPPPNTNHQTVAQAIRNHQHLVQGNQIPGGGRAAAAAGAAGSARAGQAAAEIAGPWSFLWSGFSLTLLVLSILINRIHALVPPRRPQGRRINQTIRFLIRLPSLIGLTCAIIILAPPFELPFTLPVPFPLNLLLRVLPFSLETLSLPTWLLSNPDRTDRDVLWLTFLAVSLAILTDTFVRALDDDLHTTAGFNLLSFSFLLHVHSHPYPTPSLSSNSPSFNSATPGAVAANVTAKAASHFLPTLTNRRSLNTANLNTLTPLRIHLLLTLLELLVLHTSFSLPPRLANPLRLPITGVFSLASQFFVLRGFRNAWLAALDGVFIEGPEGPIGDGTIWLSRAPEMIFESLSVMAVVLRTLSALLRREPLTREAVLGHPAFYPELSDDYAVAVIKYGTSTLESSRMTGLSNEVDPIIRSTLERFQAALPLPLDEINAISNGGATPPTPVNPNMQTVLISRGGHPVTVTSPEEENGSILGAGVGPSTSYGSSSSSKTKVGLNNEIRQINPMEPPKPLDPLARHPDRFWVSMRAAGIIAKWALWGSWRCWLGVKFLLRKSGLGRLVGGRGMFEVDWKAYSPEQWEEKEDPDWVAEESLDDDDEEDDDDSDEDSEEEGAEGEVEVEVGEFGGSEYGQREGSASVWEDEEDGDGDKPSTLLADLSSPLRQSTSLVPYASTSSVMNDDDDESLTPILLAHHLRPSSASPLTRRRYQALASGITSPSSPGGSARRTSIERDQDNFLSAMVARRKEVEWRAASPVSDTEPGRPGSARLCVVCLGEERCVILWPCRCLSICEDCRANLADRTPSSGHLCPTCRTPVKGFSRIFIP